MKKNKLLFLLVLVLLGNSITSQAQNYIKSEKGYTPQVGNLVAMLEDLKSRVTQSVEDLDQKEIDFLLDDKANRIGAMIMHLAASEKYYQVLTFENRTFNKEESVKWMVPLELGEVAREELKGKPIKYYLKEWNEVRKETLKRLKEKDDAWLNADIKKANMNNHWAWYHVMEHQANHMGQIRLIVKRVPN